MEGCIWRESAWWDEISSGGTTAFTDASRSKTVSFRQDSMESECSRLAMLHYSYREGQKLSTISDKITEV